MLHNVFSTTVYRMLKRARIRIDSLTKLSTPPLRRLDLGWAIALSEKTDKKETNQDRYLLHYDPKWQRRIMIIADGMGGKPGGDMAAAIAIQAAFDKILAGRELNQELLNQAIQAAHTAVKAAQLLAPNYREMQTTLLVAVVDRKNRLYLAHTGDCRAYTTSGEKVSLLTMDHSRKFRSLLTLKCIQEQSFMPRVPITGEQLAVAENLYYRLGNDHSIQASVGGTLEIETYECLLQKNDALYLCTDGVYCSRKSFLLDDLKNNLQPDQIMATVLANSCDNATLVNLIVGKE